ncbi:MAG: hypothetical protein EOP14_07670, partial [Pseudomonas sp.]
MKPKALCVVLLPVVAVGTYCLWPAGPGKSVAPVSVAAARSATDSAAGAAIAESIPAGVPTKEMDVAVAVQQ